MDELYFEFDVPFEDSDTLQTATFKLYNLSESAAGGGHRRDSGGQAGAAGRLADQTGVEKRNVDVGHEIRLNWRYR